MVAYKCPNCDCLINIPFQLQREADIRERVQAETRKAVIEEAAHLVNKRKNALDRVYRIEEWNQLQWTEDAIRRLVCGDRCESWVCVLEHGHPGDHKHFHSSGGCVGWPQKEKT